MSSKIKPQQTQNPINIAITLLDAADFCHHASLAADEASSLLRDNFKATKPRREIDSILLTLSKSLLLISSMVKSRATACAPTLSQPSYARARLMTASPSPKHMGTAKLQYMIEQSINQVTPRKKSTRKRKSTIITPDKDGDPPNIPVPANNKQFTIKEAIKAFDSYPNKTLKQKVIDHWSSNKWVPCYTIRYWYILVEKFRQGNSLRE